MKKLSVLLMIAAMSLMMLTGCGDKKEAGGNMFALTLNGTTVEGNKEVTPYLEKLGDNYEFSESISCAYDGMDKIYQYEHFNIYTYPEGDKDYVLEVELLDDTYATDKGVKIGMTKDDIVKAYGDNWFGDDTMMTYNKTNNEDDIQAPSLYFYLEDGVITGIGITGQSNE